VKDGCSIRTPERSHPHDNAPDCPNCGTDVFVVARDGGAVGWNCLACRTIWRD